MASRQGFFFAANEMFRIDSHVHLCGSTSFSPCRESILNCPCVLKLREKIELRTQPFDSTTGCCCFYFFKELLLSIYCGRDVNAAKRSMAFWSKELFCKWHIISSEETEHGYRLVINDEWNWAGSKLLYREIKSINYARGRLSDRCSLQNVPRVTLLDNPLLASCKINDIATAHYLACVLPLTGNVSTVTLDRVSDCRFQNCNRQNVERKYFTRVCWAR